jgi:Protein of unknown function (DUF2891)
MKQLFVLLLVMVNSVLIAQPKLYTINADSTVFTLTKEGASHFASLPMKCILQQYPNKINHTAISDSDQVLTPIQQHPSFYGCFDWHSSVHGHWMLVRLLKRFPELKEQADIRKVLNTTLTANNIKIEAEYFKAPMSRSFERTYGWAWVLKLQEELLNWNDPDAHQWRSALQPLCDTIIKIWNVYLPKQTYANRSGMHGNTAFGLSFALDYARVTSNKDFEKKIIASAKQLFLKDKNAPTIWEPDGADFFSPSLMEADLMRKILDKPSFSTWFNQWLSNKSLQHLTQLPHVSDRTDLQIVHLDGLCFSRSWCMSGIAQQLPKTDPRRKLLLTSAVKHLNQSLSTVASGNYGGEHWLASFAVYAISGGK